MTAKLKLSALTEKDGAQLKLKPFIEGHGLVAPDWAGFKIPYFNLDGSLDPSFFRFRFLQDKPSKGFAALAEAKAKPIRYSQPMGSGCGAYFPPLLDADWTDVAADPKVKLCVTEGELKAACGCKIGLPTIGLGGVWNWKSTPAHQELLPILEQFDWVGRNVTICFDSDIQTNVAVRVAASRLAVTLAGRGAIVKWTELPPALDGSKQGLDDLVFTDGTDALARVLAEATEVGPGAPFHKLNGEVAVVRSTSEIVEIATGAVWSASAFTDIVYRARTHLDYRTNSNGAERAAVKRTAAEWLAWPLRTEVPRLEYEPACDRAFTEDGSYNTWWPQRWPVAPSSAGDLKPWDKLFKHIFAGCDAAAQVWVERWLAWPLVHPGAKLATAVLVWGRQQGTGKTLLGEAVGSIYGKNYGTVNNMQLASQFNEWAVDKQFIVGDEISLGDKRGTANSLKDMITRQQVRINVKNRKSYVVRDCANYYFTSNHEDAVYLESGDRRVFVHHADVKPLPQRDYSEFQRWLKLGGTARLFHYFLHEVDFGDFDPAARAPATKAKAEMEAASRGDAEDWCAQLAADPDSVLDPVRRPWSLWRTADLLNVYDPDKRERVKAVGFGRALGAAGVFKVAGGSSNAVVEGTRSRLWAVRNVDQHRLMGSADAARAWAAERAVDPGGGVGATKKFAADAAPGYRN